MLLARQDQESFYYYKLAVVQNSEIDIVFLSDMCPYAKITATCTGLKNSHLVARIPVSELDSHPLVWGSTVECYFTVCDETIIHCHFKSRLAYLGKSVGDFMLMAFPLSSRIEFAQCRFSRRVNLDLGIEYGLKVWHSIIEKDTFRVPPPLRWRSLSESGGRVAEISASGMRLEFDSDNPNHSMISTGDIVLLRGDFGSSTRPVPIYVRGSVVRKVPKLDTTDAICVGCHFNGWCKDDGMREWFKADHREGIGLIAQWISRNFHVPKLREAI